MDLTIKEKKGVFEIWGNLSACNIHQVKKFFDLMLKLKQEIAISLQYIDTMDIASVYELSLLRVNAEQNGRQLKYSGKENAKIRGAFFGAGVNLFSEDLNTPV